MARILVIDDEADMRTMIEQALKSSGHEVALAAEGEEGVKRYRENPFDLVITDLYMPNQEGIETIRKLRHDFPSAAIVAMSGKNGATTLLTVARRLGAIAVLEKPFSFEQLLIIVDRALEAKVS